VCTACCASRTLHSLQDIVDKLTNYEACHYAVCSVLFLRPILSRSPTCKSGYEVGTPTKRLTDSSDRALHSSCHFHDGKADCVTVPLAAYSRLRVLVHPQCVFIDHKLLNVTRVRSKQVKLLYPTQRINNRYLVVFFFLWFPGVWSLLADVSEHCFFFVCLLVDTTYEDGTDRVFRNFCTQNSDAGELPKRKNTTFTTGGSLKYNNNNNNNNLLQLGYYPVAVVI